MAKFFDAIMPAHQAFIEHQKMFFVASAPLEGDGHVNLSPKGGDVFRILDPNKVAYLDYTGSGNETSAHLLQNGRTILPADEQWPDLVTLFTDIHPATRQIIVATVHKVQTSCGYSVPLYDYLGERDHAYKWAANKGPDGLIQYRHEKNRQSLDGLPTALYQEDPPSSVGKTSCL
jgi:hypothetical protein